MINSGKRERRDWTLLIFIIPIGIILIILVGQLAVRLVPFWRVNVGMNSNLEPNPESARPFALLEPILPQILTPMAWVESYLTPGAEIFFPPFLTFEPTGTPSPTAVTPSPTTDTPTLTQTPVPTSTTVTSTPPGGSPTDPPGGSSTPPPPTTCTDPAASNFGGPLPCTYPPTTCTDPLANNQGQPLPCTYDPTTCTDPSANNQGQPLPCTYDPTTCTDPAANNNGGPLPCVYGVVSTPPASYGTPAPVPSQIGVGTLPDNTDPYNDSNIGTIIDGTYIVISLSVTVHPTPDDNYDLVFYEYNNGGVVYMDWIIVGISNYSDGSQYYEVFNWGNGVPDANSNLGDVAGSETDDQPVPVSEFYDPDDAGPAPQTGVLIDVDTAPSNPPSGTYNFVVILSPIGGGSGSSAQVDAIQTVEVPTPPSP